jgi:hypothetical protein
MFYLFMLIYIKMNEFALSQTNISHTTSSKHNQHFIQPTNMQQSYRYKEWEIQYSAQWSVGTETSTRNLGVSVFSSSAINEHVLIVHPLATRSPWRGQRHRLARLEGRNGRARQGEAIRDRWVGASGVLLPPIGVL